MKTRHLLLFLFVAVFGHAQTITDIVVGSDDHNTLEAAVIAAGLDGTLAGDGPFTLFAPTDDAFAALPAGVVDALLEDPMGELTDILLYHAVSGEALSTDLTDGMEIETINGATVTVSIANGTVMINNATVTMADIDATNGVVHVIDAVLLPPDPLPTITDIVVGSDDHNTLEAAVIAAGLDGTLAGDGPFTVFAPTDAAFAALPAGVVDALLEDPMGELTQILLYHVVSGSAMAGDLADGMMIETLNGASVTVGIDNGVVSINGATVTTADVMASNGVVHVIDAVLLPPDPLPTITDIVVASDEHNTLEAAVIAAGLDGTLAGDGPFTVFAPTDAAFAALPAGVVDALLEDPMGDLTQILLYHVVSGSAMAADLADGMMIETLNGASVTVGIDNGVVTINGATVTTADVMASNGVVHVIDAVLLPPPPTVYDIIKNSDVHNTLETLVDAAGLDGALSAEGTLTVFAPTDEAFSVLPQEVVDQLLADPMGQLSQILQYHVTPSVIMAADLTPRTIGTSLTGLDYLITQDGNGDFVINANGGPGAKITVTDLAGSNGIVHVIDAIMIPTTTASVIFNSENFSILSQLLDGTGLLNTLNDPAGKTTLFAPTNQAFINLPSDILFSLADSDEELTNALLYHVTPGRTFADELSDQLEITTAQGETVIITLNSDGAFINDAQIVVTDFFTGNGIIHVIDAVLIQAPETVMDVVIRSDVHNTLQLALDTAQLAEALQAPDGTFTLFAPTDEAFGLLPDGTIESLLENPTEDLQQILLYHALGSVVRSSDLMDGQEATTLQGDNVTVEIDNGSVFINNAQVIIADIETDNGVVHVIDAVLLPATNTVDLPASEADVYPSPAYDQVTVDFDATSFDQPILYIISQDGRAMRNVRGLTPGQSINVTALPTGIYTVVISDGKSAITKRITKI